MFASLWSFLFAWYNAPFTLLLGISLILVLLQLVGLSGGDHPDSDADLDHDLDLAHDVDLQHDVDLAHDVDLDHSVDLEHSADLDHDADLDHSAEVEHGLADGGSHDGGLSTLTLLAYLGVGKVPLTVLLILLTGTIGLIGWILNSLLQFLLLGTYPAPLIVVVLPVSILAAGLLTSRVARLIGNALPPVNTTAVRNEALVGSVGTVISPFVDARYGMVHVRDSGGTLISVFATCPGAEPIRRGEKVVLLSYDAKTRFYTVKLAPASVEFMPY